MFFNYPFKHLLKTSPLSAIALILGNFGFLIFPVGLYASKGIAVIMAVAAFLCLVMMFINRLGLKALPMLLIVATLALGIWGGSSYMWTVDSGLTRSFVFTLPITFFAGLVLITAAMNTQTRDRIFIGKATSFGFIFTLVIALIDLLTGKKLTLAIIILNNGGGDWSATAPSFVINNGIVILALFLWPVALFTWHNRSPFFAILLYLIMLWVAILSSSFAAVVSLIIGSLVFLSTRYLPRFIFPISSLLLAAIFLSMPFVFNVLPDARTIGKELPPLSVSAYPRMVIWQYASGKIMNAPVIGHGLRTSRALNTETKPIDFYYRNSKGVFTGNTKAIPLHPHNGIIQLWLELGGIGAFAGLMIVLIGLFSIYRSTADPTTKALQLSALISGVLVMTVTYGLWQGWWQGTLWLMATLTIALSPKLDRDIISTRP